MRFSLCPMLLMIASIHGNITKDYPIAKPLKYLTTRSHRPLPQKRGTDLLMPQNKHPIVGCLGAAAWSFFLMS